MNGTREFILAPPAEARFTVEEICSACAITPERLHLWVEEGLVAAPPGEPVQWRFDTAALLRVRRMRRLQQDFDAVPELAALVADLLDEVSALRLQLRRPGHDPW